MEIQFASLNEEKLYLEARLRQIAIYMSDPAYGPPRHQNPTPPSTEKTFVPKFRPRSGVAGLVLNTLSVAGPLMSREICDTIEARNEGVPRDQIHTQINRLLKQGRITASGKTRWSRVYTLAVPK